MRDERRVGRGCEERQGGEPHDEAEVGWLLARATHVLGDALGAALAEHGLTPRTWTVLRVAAPAPRPQQALAQAVGLDKTTMVATVDELARRGLVRREDDPADRRVRLVALTGAGRAALASSDAVARGVEDAVLAPLDPGERATLRALLARVVAHGTCAGPRGSCL